MAKKKTTKKNTSDELSSAIDKVAEKVFKNEENAPVMEDLMNNGFRKEEIVPSLEISAVFPKEDGEDEFGYYFLKSLTGSKEMFLRLGEFLSCLTGVDKFYFKSAEGKDSLVKMTPKDEENYQEDMDQVEAVASANKN